MSSGTLAQLIAAHKQKTIEFKPVPVAKIKTKKSPYKDFLLVATCTDCKAKEEHVIHPSDPTNTNLMLDWVNNHPKECPRGRS